jgi:geranylgeranyl reductase family protein
VDWDVIVVGGGIGGAAAALFLTSQGCRVGVLEKERLPRYKTCAGGLTRHTCSLLPVPLEPVTEDVVTGVIYALRQEAQFEQSLYDQFSVMVNRAQFDRYILKHSEADVVEGAAVREVEETDRGVRVRTGDGRLYQARYLIGADGANSRVARSLGLRRHKALGVAIEAEVEAGGDIMARYRHRALFQFGSLRNGYLWIFPKSDHLSAGIGAFGKTSEDLKAILWREMEGLGIPLGRTPWRAHPLPLHLKAERLHTNRCLLVGDAAGLVDAFLGEGIRYAILSAQLASQAVLGEGLDSYSARVKTEISDGLRPARPMARVFYRYPGLSFGCLSRNPALTRAFLELMAGGSTHRAVMRRLPFYFVQSMWSRPSPGTRP